MPVSSTLGSSPLTSVVGDDGGRVVHEPVQDIPALAAIPPGERTDKMTCLVEDKGAFYRWDEQSAAADADGPAPVADDTDGVVVPNDNPANGRWLSVPNSTAVPPVYRDTRDPINTDDTAAGFVKGSIWLNETEGAAHMCADASAGAAVWIALGGATPYGSSANNLVTQNTAVAAAIPNLTATIPAGRGGLYEIELSTDFAAFSNAAQIMTIRAAVNAAPSAVAGLTRNPAHIGFGLVESLPGSFKANAQLADGDVVTVEWFLGVAGGGETMFMANRVLTLRKIRN